LNNKRWKNLHGCDLKVGYKKADFKQYFGSFKLQISSSSQPQENEELGEL
jgi:hypothetical protein